jgi:hypothetical protein
MSSIDTQSSVVGRQAGAPQSASGLVSNRDLEPMFQRKSAKERRQEAKARRSRNRRNPIRDFFKSEGWWSWASSFLVHATILAALALVISSSEDMVRVFEFEEIEMIGQGPDMELGPGFDGEIDVPMTFDAPVFGNAPSSGLTAASIPDLDLGIAGVSSISEFGTVPVGDGGLGGSGDSAREGEINSRVAAGGGNTLGHLRVSLAWEDMNDIDLHVLTPDDETIYFGNTMSSCGGELDVDANITPTTNEPVENIVWAAAPRDGVYEVRVHFYTNHRNQPATTSCDVLLLIGSEKRFLNVRALRPGQYAEVVKFEIENGQLVDFTPAARVHEGDEPTENARGPVEDEKREAQRRLFAQEAYTEAMAIEDPEGRAARLRRLIDRFPGTPAADEAQQQLQEMGESE